MLDIPIMLDIVCRIKLMKETVTMASIPAQEEILAATRKSQEAVRTVTPSVASVYSPLTDRLPKLSPVSLPFADKLPTPQGAVSSAYDMAEELLANQRTFAEELLKAMTPLMPGRSAAASKSSGSSEPKVPGRRVWQEAVAVSEPEPVAVSEPETAAAASTEPKAPAHPAAKSTPARLAPRATTAKSTAANSGTGTRTAAKSTEAKSAAAKSTGNKSTGNKSTGAKSGAGTSAAKRTTGNRAPKGTDVPAAPNGPDAS
jgi:hypothetical protein